MPGKIIQLTPARFLKEPPFIDTSIRADIGDYGPPGVHLGGPYALKGRSKAVALDIPGADGGDGNGAAAAWPCTPQGGGTLAYVFNVAAGATGVAVSAQLARPFLINHIWAVGNSPVADGAFFRIKIADDNDTLGGALTTGTDLDNAQNVGPGWNIGPDIRNFYPKARITDIPKYVKMIFVGNGGTGTRMWGGVSIEYLA